jgi:hypothetical protein
MLRTVPDIRLDRRTVLELPLAAMAEYPGTVVVIDRHGTSWPAGGRLALTEMLHANGHWHEVAAAAGRAIASDFTWETDAEGRFSFISPRGALDWSAGALVGRPVAEFLAGAGGTAEIPPVFRARAACEDGDVWFRRADGASDCLAIAAVPRIDAAGSWLGARGLGRRVTEQWQRDRDAAHGHLRDRLVTHLARTIGDEIDPLHALAAAASATGLAVSASGAAIYRRTDADELVAVAQWGA